jgi:predicted anti-sigma-YlaC factor YlaD
MNRPEICGQISDLLPEFLAGRVSSEDDARIRGHLEVCTDCRNRANAVSLLQQTPVPTPDQDRWDHFVKGVVTEADRRQRASTPGWVWAAAAVLVVIAVAIFAASLLSGSDRAGDLAIDAVAREVAELPEEEAAAWTAGLSSSEFMPAGFDTAGLSEEDIEQLVAEVGRT